MGCQEAGTQGLSSTERPLEELIHCTHTIHRSGINHSPGLAKSVVGVVSITRVVIQEKESPEFGTNAPVHGSSAPNNETLYIIRVDCSDDWVTITRLYIIQSRSHTSKSRMDDDCSYLFTFQYGINQTKYKILTYINRYIINSNENITIDHIE